MSQYVYIILNPMIDGLWSYDKFTFDHQPIYVGIGVGRRCYDHLNMNRRKYETNYTKFNLIKKIIDNDFRPIIIKLYENLSKDDAKKIEIQMISHFGKLIDNTGILTNITNGGDETNCNKLGDENLHSKKVYQYSLSGKFIKKWNCLREIERTIGFSYNCIGDCCRGKIKTSNGFQWFYEYNGDFISPTNKREQITRRKKVYKFNILSKVISTYDSLTDASIKNGLRKSVLSDHIKNHTIYDKYFYSYSNNINIKETKKSKYHLIKYNEDYLFLTNKEIMSKFNVSKFYVIDVRRKRIKTPKFETININDFINIKN